MAPASILSQSRPLPPSAPLRRRRLPGRPRHRQLVQQPTVPRTVRRRAPAQHLTSPSASGIERLVIVVALVGIWVANGRHPTDVITSVAVFIGFLHAQLSFDIAESVRSQRGRQVGAQLHLLFLLKEGLWLVAFLAVQSWPLVFGAVLFGLYPALRARLRRGNS